MNYFVPMRLAIDCQLWKRKPRWKVSQISLKSTNQHILCRWKSARFAGFVPTRFCNIWCQFYISAGKVKNNSNQIKLEMEVEIQREEKQDFRTNLRICGAVAIWNAIFKETNKMRSNKICCAALPKKTKLNHVAAISQLTSRVHRHLTGLCADPTGRWPLAR